MNILGIHLLSHDAGAALVVDGTLVADVAEERFRRIKHFSGLPVNSIKSCLDQAGVSALEIDAVAVPTENAVPELAYVVDVGREIERTGATTKARMLAARSRWLAARFPGLRIGLPHYMQPLKLNPSTQIVHVEHHLSHAAAAYYTSGISDRQVVVTLDGVGDRSTGSIWRGEGGSLTELRRFPVGGSLGWFYGNVTEALGWPHSEGEGKTMALASYGDSEQAAGTLDNYVPKYCDGELNAPHDYGINFAWDDGGQEHYHFADAGAIADVIRRCGRQHVAAEAQRVLEDRVQQLVHPWLRREGVRNLSCGGGVFLNVKLNQRMWESGLVDHHHIYPNPGDAGLAAGAAMYAHRQLSGESPMHALRTMSLGPSFSNDEIERALGERGIEARRHEDVAELAAGLLATGSIVAWFQGRMESGPRALGHRSLLMSAGHERNKDIMNERVKFRETFRPFGPSLCQERGAELLTRCRAEPFMITSFDATSAGRQAMPAVIHVDGTVRPQTVDVAVNPTYHRLLEHVNRLTDEPAVLNTSFNLAGEPLVCSPRDAIRSFFDAGADHLIMGDCWVRKAP